MGLFSSYDSEFRELLEYLTDNWQMKSRFAEAFLNTYKKSIGKIFAKGKKDMARVADHPDPSVRLAMFASIGQEHSYALVGQAYQAYMTDLRRGRYVGTDIEKAIWAILSNRSDLVGEIDRMFENYIDKNYDNKFPNLYDEVFENDSHTSTGPLSPTESSQPASQMSEQSAAAESFISCPICKGRVSRQESNPQHCRACGATFVDGLD